MTGSTVQVEKSDGIATVTLNRPDSLNALSSVLLAELKDTFAGLQHDQRIGVVILTGAGRAFCAGLDLKELAAGGGLFKRSDADSKSRSNISAMFQQLDCPVIGAVNGVAVTGGFELALSCDIIIASSEARFADTHARVGVIPGSGLSQKLSRLIGIYRAKEVSLTGNFISAEQAEAWGLVNRIVSPDDLLPTCRKLAADILSCPAGLISTYKKLIDDGFDATFKDGMELEQHTHLRHFQTVDADSISERRENIQQRGRTQQK